MTLLTVLAVVAVGIAVGVVSGLVGLGGGVLIVPFLYFFYDQPALFGVHVAPDARIILAHGTSLFVIVPISVRAALAYHKVGLVEWRVVWPIGLVSIVAAALAARIALNVRPELLQLMFGAFLAFSGVQLLRRRQRAQQPERRRRMRLTLSHTVLVGAAVGIFSALLGVGGGVVGIPLLMYFVGIDLRRVAATSMGIIVITATAGAASYMLTGAGAQGLPPGSVGYVDVVTGLAMAAGALASVRLGTSLNQTLSPRALARVFGVLFLLLGARLIINSSGMLIGWMEAI